MTPKGKNIKEKCIAEAKVGKDWKNKVIAATIFLCELLDGILTTKITFIKFKVLIIKMQV